MTILPDHILRRMRQEDRKALGKNGLTKDEMNSLIEKRTEKDLHIAFTQWLNLNQIIYRHDRMDKKTSGQVGWPDFTVFKKGKVVLIEFKGGSNELSREQSDYMIKFTMNSFPYYVCRSVEKAIELTRKILET